MNLYPVLEDAVVVSLVLVSAYYALRAAIPRTLSSAQARLSAWLDRPRRPAWLRALSRRVTPGAESGCAVACGRACNGCRPQRTGIPISPR